MAEFLSTWNARAVAETAEKMCLQLLNYVGSADNSDPVSTVVMTILKVFYKH